MCNARLDEPQAGIKSAGRNINLRHADDTILMAESEEELKSLFDEGEREEWKWGTHVYLWRIHFDIWQN